MESWSGSDGAASAAAALANASTTNTTAVAAAGGRVSRFKVFRSLLAPNKLETMRSKRTTSVRKHKFLTGGTMKNSGQTPSG